MPFLGRNSQEWHRHFLYMFVLSGSNVLVFFTDHVRLELSFGIPLGYDVYLVLFMDHDSDKFSFVSLVWSMTWTCCLSCRFVLLDHAELGSCIVDLVQHDSMFSLTFLHRVYRHTSVTSLNKLVQHFTCSKLAMHLSYIRLHIHQVFKAIHVPSLL